MAYDEELADRVRSLLEGEPGVTEKRMFGGLAFLVDGNLAVTASGQGGLMVRVDPAESAVLLEADGVHMVEMRGREMQGWLRVDAQQVQETGGLGSWVSRSLAHARGLPAKEHGGEQPPTSRIDGSTQQD